MTHLRAYRSLAVFLALSLLLSAGLPALQHACGMSGAMNDAHHAKATHHAERPHAEAAHTAAAPCTHEAECPAAHAKDCCTVEAAPAQKADAPPLAERQGDEVPVAPLLFVLAGALPPPSPPAFPAPDRRTVPSAPVALHVLHAAFLN